MDLIDQLKEFAKESAESRALALQRIRDDKTKRGKENGTKVST